MKTLRTHLDEEQVLTVWFDHADKSVNTFCPLALEELAKVIDSIERGDLNHQVTGVVFASGKPDVFVSGADLFALKNMDEKEQQQFLETGQSLFDRISLLPMPTIAAINGHCLGGGLELALACGQRVAAGVGSINIGLPETKLGIIPAWGGTTRMTKMLGLTRALPLLLEGKTLSPRKAQRAAVVDEVVRPEVLIAAARRLLDQPAPHRRPARADRVIMAVPYLCNMVCRTARRKTLAKTYGNYPAALKIIDTAQTACHDGHQASLDAERQAVRELIQTQACQNLMRLFFLRHGAKRSLQNLIKTDEPVKPIVCAAVVGGGTMGAGIVHSLIREGIPVRLLEVHETAIAAALGRIKKMLSDDLKAKRLSLLQARQALHRVSPSVFADGTDNQITAANRELKLVDIAIEAVAENMDVKSGVMAKLNRLTRPDAILASNTSSLSIGELANLTDKPHRVVGLHFFNPVPKMPLVEVVRTPHSDDRAVAGVVQLALRIGKTPIVVADAPGFLVNRVLIPYLAEAMIMACEGSSIVAIDRAMKQWGMPMGPFELLDQVGLDVTVSILKALRKGLEHIVVPSGIDEGFVALERGWLGRKSGRGFYHYPANGKTKRPTVNTKLTQTLAKANRSNGRASQANDADTADRLTMPMINEAARLLTEGVTDSTDTIDLATVLGLGLAPFRGGLVHHAESVGLGNIVERMEELARNYGPRFAPVEALRQVAQNQEPMQRLVEMRDGRPMRPSVAAALNEMDAVSTHS